MNNFSIHSLEELATADERLRRIAHIVLRIKDHSILKGHRYENEQNSAYNADPQRSKLEWPHGKHNSLPSQAIDVQTYPRPEKEQDLRAEQYYLLGLYVGVAVMQQNGAVQHFKLRTGADWDTDGEVSDNGWDDLFHVEIVGD